MFRFNFTFLTQAQAVFNKFEKSLASVFLCLLLLQTGALLAQPIQPLPKCNSSFTQSLARSSLEQEIQFKALDVQHLILKDFVMVDNQKGQRICQFTVQMDKHEDDMYATLSYAPRPTTSIQITINPELEPF